MASETQRKREALAAARKATSLVRSLETQVHRVWSELRRLRARKTLIQPDDLAKVDSLWDAVRGKNQQAEKGIIDLNDVVKM